VYSLKFGLVLKRPDQRFSHGKRLMSLACASTEPAPDFGPTTLIISVGCSFDEGVTRVANLAWHCQFNFISIHFLRSERGAFPPVHLDSSPLAWLPVPPLATDSWRQRISDAEMLAFARATPETLARGAQ
jgi:hypothetical protein